MILYDGNLQEFAADILAFGRGDGRVCRIGRINALVEGDLGKKDILLASKEIIVTQRQVFKYKNHPKAAKGANLPLDEYTLIEHTVEAPTRIYEDTSKKTLAYVFTTPYSQRKVLKVVVQPNFNRHGIVCNLAKSWGIVDKNDMLGKQYRSIK